MVKRKKNYRVLGSYICGGKSEQETAWQFLININDMLTSDSTVREMKIYVHMKPNTEVFTDCLFMMDKS
jgi:hypothetical protein